MLFSYPGSGKSILITSLKNAVFRQNFTWDQQQYESFNSGIEDLKYYEILSAASGRLGYWRRIGEGIENFLKKNLSQEEDIRQIKLEDRNGKLFGTFGSFADMVHFVSLLTLPITF